jgi:hypothetical protein
VRPQNHYDNGIKLLDTIVEYKDDEDFDVAQASALAQAATAQFVGGLLKFLLELDPYVFLRG